MLQDRLDHIRVIVDPELVWHGQEKRVGLGDRLVGPQLLYGAVNLRYQSKVHGDDDSNGLPIPQDSYLTLDLLAGLRIAPRIEVSVTSRTSNISIRWTGGRPSMLRREVRLAGCGSVIDRYRLRSPSIGKRSDDRAPFAIEATREIIACRHDETVGKVAEIERRLPMAHVVADEGVKLRRAGQAQRVFVVALARTGVAGATAQRELVFGTHPDRIVEPGDGGIARHILELDADRAVVRFGDL